MIHTKVFVEDSDYGILKMFLDMGYSTTRNDEEADIIVFSGGIDINPALYGEKRHRTVEFDDWRDDTCVGIYNRASRAGKKLIGICRGAQFLNVMNGGRLFQHVSGHTRQHNLIDLETGRTIEVTSTHHQMMRPADHGLVVATAHGQSTSREHMLDGVLNVHYGPDDDTEVVWYEDTKSLCFQPHPEYHHEDTHTYFFELLGRYF